MNLRSIEKHPILEIPDRKKVKFTFNGQEMSGFQDMMLSSALFLNGVQIFGHHHKDNSPQGLFCANGQCAQCTVIVNGTPVKSCMTPLEEGMKVQSCEGLPKLPEVDTSSAIANPKTLKTDVLIIGAGPSGLSAAKLLAEHDVKVLLVDDKTQTGGKLVLQTHKFFGSQKDVYAGKRGIEIGKILGKQVAENSNVTIWLNSTALAVFSDGLIGILKDNSQYVLVKPERLLIATGAREKMLVFPGDTLPGVYGAGAFQTLVNRDLVKAADKLFIIGGGNVGLIAGYHAIQAGIDVVGLIEALPECGGYAVHESKLRRLGVPILTRHTIISANGTDKTESVTIGKLDDDWNVIPGTEKTFACDTILIAVGLTPVDEFYQKAIAYKMPVWVAGDAQEIAEASAAIFTGKVEAAKILKDIGKETGMDIEELESKAEIMKRRPPKPLPHEIVVKEEGVFPVFHCDQEIPCNPASTVCPQEQIETEGNMIIGRPHFKDEKPCLFCGKCVAVCPGLAVTLVDFRKDSEHPTVMFPYEVATHKLEKGQMVTVMDDIGELGSYPVERAWFLKAYPKTQLVTVKLPKKIAKTAISLKTIPTKELETLEMYSKAPLKDDAIVCRCERVTAGEIRKWIRKGVTDMNQLKAITRAGMGACGGKTCSLLIERIMREEGIAMDNITKGVKRPLFVEVPLGKFAGITEDDE